MLTGTLPSTTPETWISLVITVPDPSDVLGPDDAACGGLGGTGIFNTTNCKENGDTYTLSFSDGTIGPTVPFFIEETGVDASSSRKGPQSQALYRNPTQLCCWVPGRRCSACCCTQNAGAGHANR